MIRVWSRVGCVLVVGIELNVLAKRKKATTEEVRRTPNGSFRWTYRNRFTGVWRLTIRSYHPGAYASAEFFYQSQYAK